MVKGISVAKCQKEYRRSNLRITNTQFCAGKEGVDSCRGFFCLFKFFFKFNFNCFKIKGDSGGPVISKEVMSDGQIHTYLAGIVSYGPIACGFGLGYGVYTKVAAYTDWIEKNAM